MGNSRSVTLVKTHSRKQNIKILLEDSEIFCFLLTCHQLIDTWHYSKRFNRFLNSVTFVQICGIYHREDHKAIKIIIGFLGFSIHVALGLENGKVLKNSHFLLK